MKSTDIKEIEERLEKITGGEWHVTERKAEYEDIVTFCIDTRKPDNKMLTEVCTTEAFQGQITEARIDFAFIAHAPDDIFTLLSALKASQKKVGELEAELSTTKYTRNAHHRDAQAQRIRAQKAEAQLSEEAQKNKELQEET